MAYDLTKASDMSSLFGCARYHVVSMPLDVRLDGVSQEVHGITWRKSIRVGRPLLEVLNDFLNLLAEYHPSVVIGHDLSGSFASYNQ